jgi:hypothetical protein
MKYERKPDRVYYDAKTGRTMEHRGYSTRIFWSRQMIDDFRRDYPTTLNEELAGYFGVSVRTVVRKARELGLRKDSEWLAAIYDERRQLAHVRSKAMGYPGTFKKGQRPSPAMEFKPGHRLTDEQRQRQQEGLHRWVLTHPDKVSEKGRKVSLWASNNPDLVEARNRKVSETKRRNHKEAAGL